MKAPILFLAVTQMATLVREHRPEDFAQLIAELERRPLAVNHDRRIAGKGQSQAFGVIRRWSYRPWLSRNTWMRPDLWALLLEFAEKHAIFGWDAVQVNSNYASAPHRDTGNHGLSYIVGFGDYVDGDLDVEGVRYNIRHRGHLFNGSELTHSTAQFTGNRYCLVFFRIVFPTKFQPGYAISCRLVDDGLEITDNYDDSCFVLDKKGRTVRTIQAGRQMPWIGKLTQVGQRSRNPHWEETPEPIAEGSS
jgi:hypothetical protein